MRILSWNVQGPGGPLCYRYRGRLRQELNKCFIGGPLDVLLIQEHHLNSNCIAQYGTFLKGSWDMHWSEAYGTSGNKGGVCISIAEKWRPYLENKRVIVRGRGQYVELKVDGVSWGILNVYAPNHASARTLFWTQICDALQNIEHWCMAGDFNMLEDPNDRRGGSTMTVRGSKLGAWERLCFKMGIQDVWFLNTFCKEPNSLRFSRSSRRMNEVVEE